MNDLIQLLFRRMPYKLLHPAYKGHNYFPIKRHEIRSKFRDHDLQANAQNDRISLPRKSWGVR